jgi:hypothetical protein
MGTMIGIYQISISEDADHDAFEEFMKTKVFPTVAVGRQTRGGMATQQLLLKGSSSDDYCWIVRWVDQGGSPFGRGDAPPDPAPQLASFGAKSSFSRYELKAEQAR